jgi:UDP-N-acetylglucosamine acyltransferase
VEGEWYAETATRRLLSGSPVASDPRFPLFPRLAHGRSGTVPCALSAAVRGQRGEDREGPIERSDTDGRPNGIAALSVAESGPRPVAGPVSRVSARIHPTALVDPSAEIGAGVEIGAYAWIGPRVTIGADSIILHHGSVVSHTTLGERNVVHPHAVVGGDPQDKKFVGEECWLHIGDRNVFRENVTVNRGTSLGGGVTRIGNDCLLLAGVHIAIIIANGVQLGGHVVVQDQAGFGGLSAVHHYVTVGRLAFIGGMTRVTADAPPFLITEGHPSRVRSVNKVGLTRAGVTEETTSWLKEAQRLLYHHRIVRREAFDLLEKRGKVPEEGLELRAFLRAAEEGRQGRARQP